MKTATASAQAAPTTQPATRPAEEPAWGKAFDDVQVQLRLEPTIGSDREAPTFRAFVRSQNGKDMLLSTIQGQGCELRLTV